MSRKCYCSKGGRCHPCVMKELTEDWSLWHKAKYHISYFIEYKILWGIFGINLSKEER